VKSLEKFIECGVPIIDSHGSVVLASLVSRPLSSDWKSGEQLRYAFREIIQAWWTAIL
jgi:hypothetical protein